MILSWYYLRPQSSPNRSCRVETHQTNQQLRHGGDADQGGAAARSPGTAAGPDGRAAVTWWKSRKFMVPLGIARKIPREMDDIIWIYQLDGYIYIPPGIFLIIIDDIIDYYGYIIRWYHIFSGSQVWNMDQAAHGWYQGTSWTKSLNRSKLQTGMTLVWYTSSAFVICGLLWDLDICKFKILLQ